MIQWKEALGVGPWCTGVQFIHYTKVLSGGNGEGEGEVESANSGLQVMHPGKGLCPRSQWCAGKRVYL